MKTYLRTDNAYDIIEKNKSNILELIFNQGQSPDSGGVPWLDQAGYSNITEFGNKAKNYEVIKYNINADGTNNKEGFLFLVKTPSGIKEFRTWSEVKEYIDYQILLLSKRIDNNHDSIQELIDAVQSIENTWTGNLLMSSSGTLDLSKVQGDKGAFDFTAGKKLIITVGTMGSAITDTKVLKIGTSGNYHLVGEGIDATFGITVSDSGVATIQNFSSTGATSIIMHNITVKEIEQNPKITSVIDAYTKAESDDRYVHKAAAADYTPSFTHQAGFIVASAPSGIDALPDNTVMTFDLSGIDSIATNPAVPAADDQLFIGSIGVRIPNDSGSASLKWITKTNPSDTNVQENYKTKFLEVKLKTVNGRKELDFINWNKRTDTDVYKKSETYSKSEIDAMFMLDDGSMVDLENLAITTK